MKSFKKTCLLLTALLLLAANSWALPFVVGDSVTMGATGLNYTLTHEDADYNAFCVEKDEYFSDGGTYLVESVGDTAYLGGRNTDDGDPVSAESIWLYASFFNGIFGDQTDALADQVQNAIWFAEDEIDDNSDFNYFTAFANDDFSISGWDIQVVNLVDGVFTDGAFEEGFVHKQSQLVGVTAPVPEPSTMLLLGSGLLGLAYYRRRKS